MQQENDLLTRLTAIEKRIEAIDAAEVQQEKNSAQYVDDKLTTLVRELKPYGIHSTLYEPPVSIEPEPTSTSDDAAPEANSSSESIPSEQTQLTA